MPFSSVLSQLSFRCPPCKQLWIGIFVNSSDYGPLSFFFSLKEKGREPISHRFLHLLLLLFFFFLFNFDTLKLFYLDRHILLHSSWLTAQGAQLCCHTPLRFP
uniref:Uncharacterized protein n=1 Tax=Trypanosoma congolense (strain IL3000) TaxID=1068625 RepID=G0UKS6_TRYCI|nr:hypothetical protein, unlikely [Trypanosoma congolense IL3000]